MKKCPFCKADIEDNARFCLYCMKPLNEKDVIPPPQRKLQWWPFAVAAVLLVALLVVILLIPKGNADRPSESTGEESTSTSQTVDSQASQTTDEGTQNTQNEGGESQGDTTLDKNQNAAGTPDTNQKPNQSQNSNTQTPTESTTPATKPTTPTNPTTTPQETTQPEETTEETTLPENTTVPETQKTEVVYTYRAARAGDDFNAQYQNTGNDIVITGISQSSVDGTYDIPSYIDGKKVIAIVANAFSGSNAKVVYIPATVKTIWNYAFADCGLTDLYFRGNAIYTESSAFSGSIIIHCSATCSDRNYRYYKNSAANYRATWAEWNG